MFSVNIDKIVVMTDNEKKCYEELRENLKKELNGGKVLAITKNGMGAFKIAYSFVCAGEKVLFIDADIMSEIFLGKYKLGKNLKGVADFLKKPSQMYDLICKTNNPQLNTILSYLSEYISINCFIIDSSSSDITPSSNTPVNIMSS